jgi:outer membrane lipoprotein carrier protein
LVLCGLGPLWAGGNNASSSSSSVKTLELFESRYRPAKTLSAVFLEQFSDNGKLVRSESGRAYFLHPGKMRWDYEAPEKNMFLVDGKYVWFYSPADHTATRMPTKKSEDWRTPLAFLTSDMKLSRICARVEAESGVAPSESGDLVFRCAMRTSQGGDTGVRTRNQPEGRPVQEEGTVLFELSPEGELRRIVIAQEGRTQLEFSFKGWLWNPALPKSWFEFVPPMGVAIVDGLLSDEPGLRQ